MTSHQQEQDERIKRALKQALPPTEDQPRAILEHDLWPAMRRRIDEKTIRIPIWDWAIAAAVLAWIAFYPQGALALLYHL